MIKKYRREADSGVTEDSEQLPSDSPIPPPTTGTVDDDDAPADERDDENEARVRETNENTQSRGEFQRDDEDRDTE